MRIEIFEAPLPDFNQAEEMQDGGSVKPRKMFRGGMGGFELPENLQELIGYAPQNLTGNVIEDAEPAPQRSDPEYQFGPFQGKKGMDAFKADLTLTPAQLARQREDLALRPGDADRYGLSPYSGLPTTEGAAEFLYGFGDPYYDTTGTTEETTTETVPTEEVTVQTIQEMIEEGNLTPEYIQELINAESLTRDDVYNILQTGFSFSEEQMAQLFDQGILTRDEIASLVDEAVAAMETGEETGEALTEEEVAEIAASSGMTEDQINELISQQIGGQDMSQFVTQPQLQEQISGLEGLFQNYLTPEQLQGYLDEQGAGYDQTIQELQGKLGTLEQQYQDVTSQYEADAVQNQIDQTKDDLNTYFASAAPTGPRTGSTSQFKSGSSFLPGGSPMANLIGMQREGQGQDPFSTYLKTFTPSYSDYNAPFTAEEYGSRNQPLIGTQYSNPFTGGASYRGADGGQISSNGIMDLTNFDTNVQPFQNAFRPNKPRT
jgi:uncharacterized protein YdeI (YjbR/CyaY-like superfamily)